MATGFTQLQEITEESCRTLLSFLPVQSALEIHIWTGKRLPQKRRSTLCNGVRTRLARWTASPLKELGFTVMLCDLPGHGWKVALIPSVDFRRGGQRFGLSMKDASAAKAPGESWYAAFVILRRRRHSNFTAELPSVMQRSVACCGPDVAAATACEVPKTAAFISFLIVGSLMLTACPAQRLPPVGV